MEEQRKHTKGLEAELQRARQRILNAEATVQSTKTANEAMKERLTIGTLFMNKKMQ